MPTYRLTSPDNSIELLQADSARREGIHTVLRGTAYVMGRPMEGVLRRVPQSVCVEIVDEPELRSGIPPGRRRTDRQMPESERQVAPLGSGVAWNGRRGVCHGSATHRG